MVASGSRVVLGQHSRFGRSAYAGHAIQAGDLVLCEQPLLSYRVGATDSSLEQLLQLVQQQLQQPEHAASSSECEDGSWEQACIELLAFCRATSNTQNKVLNGMFNTPQGPGNEGSAPVRRTLLQSHILASLAPQLEAVLQAEGTWRNESLAMQMLSNSADLQRMLLSFELNAHMTDTGRALFELGSKLPHTCDIPNTTYAFCQGQGCHIATRDIAAGELLTSCYIGHKYLLLDTYARQMVLQYDFGFLCQCTRCCQVDSLAALPCQVCAPSAAKRDAATGLLSNSLELKVQRRSSSSSSGLRYGSGSDEVVILAGSDSGSTVGLLRYDPWVCSRTQSTVQSTAAAAAAEISSPPSQHACSSCRAETPASSSAAPTAINFAAAAVARPWICSSCGVQLPSTDTALFGQQQPEQLGSNSPKFDPLLYLRASMYPRVLNCRSCAIGSCHEPLQRVQQLQQLLSEVLQWVGPFHWAVHFVRSAQTDCLRSWLLEAATDAAAAAAAQTAAAPDPASAAAYGPPLSQLQQAAEQISICMQQTWSWLTDWAGMSNEQAAYIMCQPLVHNACALLESAAQLLQLPQQHPDQRTQILKTPGGQDQLDDVSTTDLRDQQQLRYLTHGREQQRLKDDVTQHLPGSREVERRIQEIGKALLAKAEPRLAQLHCWPLSDVEGFSQHQLVESVQEARETLAAAGQDLQQRGSISNVH